MSNEQNLQDRFLTAMRDQRIQASVYLNSGIRLQGTVDGFDRYTVKLKNVAVQSVYKHAISTIVPAREVKIAGASDTAENA